MDFCIPFSKLDILIVWDPLFVVVSLSGTDEDVLNDVWGADGLEDDVWGAFLWAINFCTSIYKILPFYPDPLILLISSLFCLIIFLTKGVANSYPEECDSLADLAV